MSVMHFAFYCPSSALLSSVHYIWLQFWSSDCFLAGAARIWNISSISVIKFHFVLLLKLCDNSCETCSQLTYTVIPKSICDWASERKLLPIVLAAVFSVNWKIVVVAQRFTLAPSATLSIRHKHLSDHSMQEVGREGTSREEASSWHAGRETAEVLSFEDLRAWFGSQTSQRTVVVPRVISIYTSSWHCEGCLAVN